MERPLTIQIVMPEERATGSAADRYIGISIQPTVEAFGEQLARLFAEAPNAFPSADDVS